jgi:hypothetical protein
VRDAARHEMRFSIQRGLVRAAHLARHPSPNSGDRPSAQRRQRSNPHRASPVDAVQCNKVSTTPFDRARSLPRLLHGIAETSLLHDVEGMAWLSHFLAVRRNQHSAALMAASVVGSPCVRRGAATVLRPLRPVTAKAAVIVLGPRPCECLRKRARARLDMSGRRSSPSRRRGRGRWRRPD